MTSTNIFKARNLYYLNFRDLLKLLLLSPFCKFKEFLTLEILSYVELILINQLNKL